MPFNPADDPFARKMARLAAKGGAMGTSDTVKQAEKGKRPMSAVPKGLAKSVPSRKRKADDSMVDLTARQGYTQAEILAQGSVFKDPQILKDMDLAKLVLPEDKEFLEGLGDTESSDTMIGSLYQGLSAAIHLSSRLYHDKKELSSRNRMVDATLAREESVVKKANDVEARFAELENRAVDAEGKFNNAARTIAELEEKVVRLERDHAKKIEDMQVELDDAFDDATLMARATLMGEFLEHKGEKWNPEEEIKKWETVQQQIARSKELMGAGPASGATPTQDDIFNVLDRSLGEEENLNDVNQDD